MDGERKGSNMTKDDIISMGHEADAYASCEWDPAHWPIVWKQVRDEHFANLVAEREREICAVTAFNACTDFNESVRARDAIWARSQS
jgi:hypothetical protein